MVEGERTGDSCQGERVPFHFDSRGQLYHLPSQWTQANAQGEEESDRSRRERFPDVRSLLSAKEHHHSPSYQSEVLPDTPSAHFSRPFVPSGANLWKKRAESISLQVQKS